MIICSVHDSKADAFLPPFVCRSKGEAIRSFTDAVQTPDHMFNKHPSDFTLFKVAGWDEFTGAVASCDKEAIVNGVEVLEVNNQSTQTGLRPVESA